MAAVAKSGTPSLATTLPCPAHQLSGQTAGEALGAFDACYIKASDGKVYKSDGTAANAAAKVRGYAAQAYASGDTDVTLYWNVRVRYGSGMTPGTDLFLATSAGTLVDAATTGGTAPIGYVVDATRVELWRSTY